MWVARPGQGVGQEQLLGRGSRGARWAIQLAARSAYRLIVDERPNRAQRMLPRYEGFQGDLVAQRPLRVRVSPHRLTPPCPPPAALRCGGSQKTAGPSTLSATC